MTAWYVIKRVQGRNGRGKNHIVAQGDNPVELASLYPEPKYLVTDTPTPRQLHGWDWRNKV